MIQYKQFLILACLAVCISANAQVDIEYIKSNPDYYWAESEGETVEEADENALGQISRQISVSISSSTSHSNVQNESEKELSFSSIQKGNIQTFSATTLQNVNILILSQGPPARVFRYVHKKEVNKMFEMRANKIIDFITTGKQAEKRLQIDDALRYYYWALILAKTNPNPVAIEFNGKEGNCLVLLPLKIKSVLANLNVKVVDYETSNGHILPKLHFSYAGKDISTLQFKYFDGQSFVGPVYARDGIGEIDLLTIPANNKITLHYEVRFRNEAENLDVELRSAFSGTKAPIIENSSIEIPIKINRKKQTAKQMKNSNALVGTSTIETMTYLSPEKPVEKERIPLKTVSDNAPYLEALSHVEEAIKSGNIENVRTYFSPESYQMFNTLLNKTGKVSLSGTSSYTFIDAQDKILARFCHIKIKFKNGRIFMENLTFRFNPTDKKIHSLAFALTKKAEDDIFNAAAQWSQISRYTILNFLEDYQTAYALKRLDYLKQIFSENAIIITGTVLTTTSPTLASLEEGRNISIGEKKNIRYSKMNKSEFIKRLSSHFNSREYIHLTFEDNVTHIINTNDRVPYGDAFGIQIKQIYNSPSYSDKGYLTLMLNMQGELPVIEVRLWQPDKDKMVDLDKFFSTENFSW